MSTGNTAIIAAKIILVCHRADYCGSLIVSDSMVKVMVLIDYILFMLYLAGMLAAAMFFSRRMRSASDMFSAGGRSPWWVSGLSGFMTMFSAGTFVVWGGIAYRYGLVAVMINLCYGVGALIVGAGLAARWKKMGVSSATEFLRIRFGNSIVQFYTWLQGTILVFALGGAIYALAVVACALMPIPDGHLLQLLADPQTGNLSVPILSIALCVVVIMIALSGGLWAVLMTDVLQFVILAASVLFVVPLIISNSLTEAGSLSALLEKTPTQDFFSPIAGDYTWWFLTGWVIVHAFKIGGEWSFVQRFTCVPSPRDARKSAFIFGAMYLVSPIFWMLPPLLYRLLNPIPDGLSEAAIAQLAERAYIVACASVLPAGMLGLMVAAMASATASMATTGLNVYAGAFTTELYKRMINPTADNRQEVRAGRIFTLILGGLMLAGTIVIPRIGYAGYIIRITSLLTVPLVAPTIWGIYSKKIGLKAVWSVTILGFAAALLVQFGLCADGWLSGLPALSGLAGIVQSNQEVANLVTGIAVPLIALLIMELIEKNVHPGWIEIQDRAEKAELETVKTAMLKLPLSMVGMALIIIGIAMLVLAAINRSHISTIAAFGLVQIILALGLLRLSARMEE
jgi:solute:Na+ symporter, SSS family